MARTADEVEIDPQMITFVLTGIPESVPLARFHIRAALSFHKLDEYADNAEAITSELVTNAIQHACGNGTGTIGVTLVRVQDPASVAVVVSDPSPEGPARRDTPAGSDWGRGLQIVEALSVHWTWHQEDGGKKVIAVLAREA